MSEGEQQHTAPATNSNSSDNDSESTNSSVDSAQFNGVIVGICAMNCKSRSRPMDEILSRMEINSNVKFILFSDDMILDEPISSWPSCDALIAFHSTGFPLDKAIEYVHLKKPRLVINDLDMQYTLLDRRQVYKILEENDIDVPKYFVVNSNEVVNEMDDTIEINGHTLSKPFVEKPVSAEDHSVYLYFPSDYGGGSQRLFRKVNDRSSSYSHISSIRRNGSFIYEEFLATDGTDVKVYTVGPDYAHAEARKSPTLDGRVDRDPHGKEKRYPVILDAKEKLIARKVSLAFKQTVCGFDMLRANGRSYVCDVNGFSFVKTSEKYYDDCAQILLETILSEIAPQSIPSIAPTVEYLAPAVPVPIPSGKAGLQLRCVIGIIRHGDRTPKQKMKMIVKDPEFFTLFKELGGYKKGTLKIKSPKELQRVLDISCSLLDELSEDDPQFKQKLYKFKQVKSVLQMYSHFSGINRKVQFKLITRTTDGTVFTSPVLLLILKWGGVLTPSGEMCAEELGKAFRCMYPGGEGEYSSLPGSGFLRLHSTYRHDLKVYASDEGRVQLTAAAFTKGLLDLEGNNGSIVVHLVRRDQSATNMLDTSSDAAETLHDIKRELHGFLRSKDDFADEQIKQIAPNDSPTLISTLKTVKNPHNACERLYQRVSVLLERLEELSNEVNEREGDNIQLMINRWKKLKKDFKLDNDSYDISKIPDIYDCVKYDLQHNRSLVSAEALPVYKSAIQLADIVVPQEYGVTIHQKLEVSKKICSSLFKKIRSDLQHSYSDKDPEILHRLDPEKSHGVISPKRNVRTRLYFTSESHIHSLVNMLKHGSLLKGVTHDNTDNLEKFLSCPEWNYLSQIVFMVYEDISKPAGEGLDVQLHISPGVRSREMIKEDTLMDLHSPTSDKGIDLPIVINPSSTKFRRRTQEELLDSTIAKKLQKNFWNQKKDVPHSHPSTSSSGSATNFLSTNCVAEVPSPKFVRRCNSDPDLTNLPNATATENLPTVTAAKNSSKEKMVKPNVHNNSLDRRAMRKPNKEGGGFLRLVSVVEPLVHLCSVPIKKMERCISEFISSEDIH